MTGQERKTDRDFQMNFHGIRIEVQAPYPYPACVARTSAVFMLPVR